METDGYLMKSDSPGIRGWSVMVNSVLSMIRRGWIGGLCVELTCATPEIAGKRERSRRNGVFYVPGHKKCYQPKFIQCYVFVSRS